MGNICGNRGQPLTQHTRNADKKKEKGLLNMTKDGTPIGQNLIEQRKDTKPLFYSVKETGTGGDEISQNNRHTLVVPEGQDIDELQRQKKLTGGLMALSCTVDNKLPVQGNHITGEVDSKTVLTSALE